MFYSEYDIGLTDQKGYTNTYYIQKFQSNVPTINNLQMPTKGFDKDKLSKALHVEFRSF